MIHLTILSVQLESYKTITLNTYVVEFTGRVPNENNGVIVSTTFNYTVSGTNQTPQLDNFFLQVPGCSGTPVSWTPSTASSLSNEGIKWNSSISKNGSQDFSVTYDGDISFGIVEAVVTRGSNVAKGNVIGPCNEVVTISGSIFIDANKDGIKQNNESGINDVSILLKDNSSRQEVATIPTLSGGTFSFRVLKGNYTVSVSDELFNQSYMASTPSFFNLGDISENNSNIHFGYLLDAQKVAKELSDGTIPRNSEPTKYWINQFNQAGKRGGDYSVQQMDEFLVKIENLLLATPFQFGADKKKTASGILKNPIKTDLDAFLQQLLTAELNVVSNRGALTVINGVTVLNEGFNSAMLINHEAIACDEMGACAMENGRQSSLSLRTENTTLLDGTTVLSAFNGTGGIRR